MAITGARLVSARLQCGSFEALEALGIDTAEQGRAAASRRNRVNARRGRGESNGRQAAMARRIAAQSIASHRESMQSRRGREASRVELRRGVWSSVLCSALPFPPVRRRCSGRVAATSRRAPREPRREDKRQRGFSASNRIVLHRIALHRTGLRRESGVALCLCVRARMEWNALEWHDASASASAAACLRASRVVSAARACARLELSSPLLSRRRRPRRSGNRTLNAAGTQ